MNYEEKLSLMHSFPPVPNDIMQKMKSTKGAENFAVLLSKLGDDKLYIRCFHKYSKIKDVAERHRYIFDEKSYVRYGFDSGGWNIRKNLREPVFYRGGYGGFRDNLYTILNLEAVKNTCMKYSAVKEYYIKGFDVMNYLRFYQKHKNAELLLKTGFIELISNDDEVNWKADNLQDMLGLGKGDIKTLIKNKMQDDYYLFKSYREKYPDVSADRIVKTVKALGYSEGAIQRYAEMTGLTPFQINDYLEKYKISFFDWRDYLNQCEKLGYDMHNKKVNRPKNMHELHTKYSRLIKIKANAETDRKIKEAMEKRKYLTCTYKDLILILPSSAIEIIDEGKALCHCVGSYAERHADGKLTILFLRKIKKPDVPYYTIEVTNEGEIRQCRGYKNNVVSNGGTSKPPEIIEFEKFYQNFLDKIFCKKIKRKTA